MTTSATGDDGSYQLQVQKLVEGSWEDHGDPIEVTSGNTGSVTIGPDQRVTAAGVDPGSGGGNDTDNVTGNATTENV